MTVLILILVQIIVLVLCLMVIFAGIDTMIANGRRSGFLPTPRKIWRMPQTSRDINISSVPEWQQLLARLQYDDKAAERLINSLRTNYPGQSDRWYIEKAIEDLDRDRR